MHLIDIQRPVKKRLFQQFPLPVPILPVVGKRGQLAVRLRAGRGVERIGIRLPNGSPIRLRDAEFIAVVVLCPVHGAFPNAAAARHGNKLPAGEIPRHRHRAGMGGPQAETVDPGHGMRAEIARCAAPCPAEKRRFVHCCRLPFSLRSTFPTGGILPRKTRNDSFKYFNLFPAPRQEMRSSGHRPAKGGNRCLIYSICSCCPAAPMSKSLNIPPLSRRSICSMTRMSLSTSIASD